MPIVCNINEPTTYKREIRQETEIRRQKEEDEKEEKRRCNMVEVLIQISRKCKFVERSISQGNLRRAQLMAIESSLLNLRRIEELLSSETMEELVSSISDLRLFLRQSLRERREEAFTVPRIRSGRLSIQILWNHGIFQLKWRSNS